MVEVKADALESRRITAEDRLVYRVQGTGKDQVLEIIQCRCITNN